MTHCPMCPGGEQISHDVYVPCPGCPACAEKDKALKVADEMAALAAEMTLGSWNVNAMYYLVKRYREARALSST